MRKLDSALLTVSSILATAPVLAQTTAPAPGAATGGGVSWLWILLLLILVAAAVWYFAYGRRRATTTGSPGMDRDRIEGSAQQAKGSVKEGAGSLVGDTKLQAEGRADKVEGKVQNTLGGIKDTLRDK